MIGLFAFSLFIGSVTPSFQDMDDDDFAAYLNFHDEIRVVHGESFTKGCVTGAVGAAPAGFQALCLGCALGGIGNVAADKTWNSFPTMPERKK